MQRVLAIEFAKFHLFQTTGGIAFFLGRRIVAPFALGAFQNNQFAHFLKLSLIVNVSPNRSLQSGPGIYRLRTLPPSAAELSQSQI